MTRPTHLHNRKVVPTNRPSHRLTLVVALALGVTFQQASLYAAGLRTVALSGQPALGTPDGVTYGSFGAHFLTNVPIEVFRGPVINDAGQVAFRADLAGAGVDTINNQGIWVEGDDTLELVARTGDPAPGTASGVLFSGLSRPTLNDAGQIAFRGDLTGIGVGSGNNLGIWATDPTGELQLIARKGALLEVAPGDSRAISDLGFVTDSGNSDGRASAFNDLGQLVFWARFIDGSQGVFVSSAVAVPEPTSILLAATGLGVLILRRRRRTSNSIHASNHIVNSSGRNLMESSTFSNHLTVAHKNQFARRVSIALALAAGAALRLAPAIAAQGATIEFDASAESPAAIPFDPDASFEARGAYVSGRVPTDVKGPVMGGTNINTLVGADAFYSQGYTGTNAVIANIESGHIWSGHETLTHVQQIPNHPDALNEIDRHATWVGMILAGRQGGANPGAYQEGMAPDAQLYSGALASQFEGQRYTVGAANFNNAVTFNQYRRAFSTDVNAAGRHADVINSSWGGGENSNGSGTRAVGLDGLANANPRTLFVAVAGNEGPGPDKVRSPAAAYNNLSVAALGPNPPYDRPARFSSGGPNDYFDPVNRTINDARQVVDIAAPGENLSSAYYGGETGGNGTTDNLSVPGPGPTGLPSGSLGGPDFYSRGALGGTSFAAPTVAGGAALLYDAAYSVFADNADARDARVMKAVLMNSADKTIGWDNGQVAHPNGNGGVLTTQGLDNRVGTGRMNLAAAYDQFLSGTTDIAGTSSGNLGLVEDIGWDFGDVVSGTTNDYFFDSPLDGGSTFTATLTWFRDRRIDDSNTVFDDSFDDLNLELWSVVDGAPASRISVSRSLYNESEHFSFALPLTGDYALRVRWFDEVFDRIDDANQELYGLAWWAGAPLGAVAVPEPASTVLLAMAAMALGTSRRALRRYRRVLIM